MTLGAITDEISTDLEHALDVMLDYDARAVELRGVWGENILALTAEQQERARQAVQSRGMQVVSIAGPLYKCELYADGSGGPGPPDAAEHAHQLELLEQAIQLCDFFGSKIIRTFAFWRRGPLTDGVFEDIVRAMAPAVRRAEQTDLALGLENEHACYLGSGAEAARLLQRFDTPALRAIWDPGNAYFTGEIPYPDGYAAVREYIIHLHVKDAVTDADGKRKWAPVSAGEIDYRGQLGDLAKDGFSGVLSLETHCRAPDGDREAPSRQSLAALRQLMGELRT